MRSVSVLEVAEVSLWDLVDATAAEHLGEWLDPLRRIAKPSFEEVAPQLAGQGVPVLLRWARRDRAASPEDLAERLAALPAEPRRVLRSARHHALDGIVLGNHAWDPENDAQAVRVLVGAGLLEPVYGDEPFSGRYHLHPDLAPDSFDYDFADAVMEETDDLGEPKPGPVALLHDLASLAAAIEHVRPKRTAAGTVAKADAKRISTRLAVPDMDADRWARAMRALEALHVVSTDPLSRELQLDLGLETTLSGETADAVDHLVHRLVERDLHSVLPAVRAALEAAGDGAVDELVFLELLREQHRDVVFPSWVRDGRKVYPVLGDERPRPYDADGFEHVETPMIGALLGRLVRLGLIRRAPGVFAGTADGRVWAGVTALHAPPVWVSSDLEILVPPDAITPWERFQIERLGRCLARDVVDRYRIERRSVETWLSTHDIDEALAVLRRRAPGIPASVEDTLRAWARSAMRVVLTRGVLLE